MSAGRTVALMGQRLDLVKVFLMAAEMEIEWGSLWVELTVSC